MHTYIHTYIHAYMHRDTQIHTHTHTHTHTYANNITFSARVVDHTRATLGKMHVPPQRASSCQPSVTVLALIPTKKKKKKKSSCQSFVTVPALISKKKAQKKVPQTHVYPQTMRTCVSPTNTCTHINTNARTHARTHTQTYPCTRTHVHALAHIHRQAATDTSTADTWGCARHELTSDETPATPCPSSDTPFCPPRQPAQYLCGGPPVANATRPGS